MKRVIKDVFPTEMIRLQKMMTSTKAQYQKTILGYYNES